MWSMKPCVRQFVYSLHPMALTRLTNVKRFSFMRLINCRSVISVQTCMSLAKSAGQQKHYTTGTASASSAVGHPLKLVNFHNLKLSDCVKLLTKEDINAKATEILTNLSAEDSRRLSILRLEHTVFSATGVRVPTILTDDQWLHVLQKLPSVSARKNYYGYLASIEFKEFKEKAQQVVRQQVHQAKLAESEQKRELGAPIKNQMFLHLYDTTVNANYSHNLCHAAIYGPHIVWDCSFEENMVEREIINLCDQFALCHGINRQVPLPFHLHLCNLRPDGFLARNLLKTIPNIDDLPISITDTSYLQCYPRESLVYLSPDAPTALHHFDDDEVYIIGAIVDKATQQPLTLAKAKRENIRTARFPLDQYVRWMNGPKSLTLDTVTRILLTLRETNDWKKAFTNLPKRNIAAKNG